jgi:F0F1-type ATP synthase membrane subunit c/vacuolar-type H+-ATPase subunit K
VESGPSSLLLPLELEEDLNSGAALDIVALGTLGAGMIVEVVAYAGMSSLSSSSKALKLFSTGIILRSTRIVSL